MISDNLDGIADESERRYIHDVLTALRWEMWFLCGVRISIILLATLPGTFLQAFGNTTVGVVTTLFLLLVGMAAYTYLEGKIVHRMMSLALTEMIPGITKLLRRHSVDRLDINLRVVTPLDFSLRIDGRKHPTNQ